MVGGSGSGKSTLARLLFRLYQPDAGIIRIDGQDLRLVTERSLRDALGIVPQDTILFNDTLAYNIGYGKRDSTRAEIIAAARSAQLDAFIERLPDAYDTRVGERGVRLSGGERQRVAIARALLKAPPIVVFDEATSALDTRSERAIQQELMRVAQHRTSLIIAHRLSTVVDTDRILVMEHGRLVEQGTHDELLASGGVYAQMWALQAKQRELERTEAKFARLPVRINPLVAQVLDSLADAAAQRAVPVFRQLADEDLVVKADAAALRRFAWEMCRAGIDAARERAVQRRSRAYAARAVERRAARAADAVRRARSAARASDRHAASGAGPERPAGARDAVQRADVGQRRHADARDRARRAGARRRRVSRHAAQGRDGRDNLARRGRRLGADLFEEVRRNVPLDLVGMGSAELGGIGEVPNPALPQFLSHYRFFFNPIRYTSLGLAVIEAMMIGLPIVALATTEMAQLVKTGSNGVADTRPAALIDAMRMLIRDADLAREWGAAAKRDARERFGIERFARDWDSALRDVAA